MATGDASSRKGTPAELMGSERPGRCGSSCVASPTGR
jgi:hypothetical protein